MLEIFSQWKQNTVRCGMETISYRTPYLWTNLPEEYKIQNFTSKLE